jgi:hypothetical protein
MARTKKTRKAQTTAQTAVQCAGCDRTCTTAPGLWYCPPCTTMYWDGVNAGHAYALAAQPPLPPPSPAVTAVVNAVVIPAKKAGRKRTPFTLLLPCQWLQAGGEGVRLQEQLPPEGTQQGCARDAAVWPVLPLREHVQVIPRVPIASAEAAGLCGKRIHAPHPPARRNHSCIARRGAGSGRRSSLLVKVHFN